MLKKKMTCLLAVIALCGTMTAGAAEYTILEKADKVETTIYGATQSGSLNDRVAALDKLLNGKSTVTGSLQDKTNALYKDVYGSTGSDLSLLTTTNLMQWQYAGQITDEPIVDRIDSLEESVDGRVRTGSLINRVHSLRYSLLGNKKYVSQEIVIPAETIIPMAIQDELNSKTAQEGDIVRFAVAEDVLVDDVVVIPRGMEATGTITKARKSGRFGKDGKIEITFDSVRAADSTPVPLTVGEKTKDEYKRTAGAVGASAAGAIILGPVGLVGGLFVHGNDVTIDSGTTMYAETKEDTEVVGFQQDGIIDDLKTANMAASGVKVTSSQTDVADFADEPGYHGGAVPADDVNFPEEQLENDAAADTIVTITPVESQTTGDVHE